MKKVGIVAILVIAVMLFTGCNNSNNADDKATVNESLAVSSSVGNTTQNSNSEIVNETESSSKAETKKPTTATAKTTAKETTTAKTSTTSKATTKSATKQTTTKKVTTTQKQTTAKKVTTTKKTTTTEDVWDCNVDGHTSETGQIGWVDSFDTAKSKALEYASRNGNSGNFRVEQCHICGKYTAYITFD